MGLNTVSAPRWESKNILLPYIAYKEAKKAVKDKVNNIRVKLLSYTDREEAVKNAINKLKADGLIEFINKDDNQELYSLTDKGASNEPFEFYLSNVIENNLYNIILLEATNRGQRVTLDKMCQKVGNNYSKTDIDLALYNLGDELHTLIQYYHNRGNGTESIELKNAGALYEYIEDGGYIDPLYKYETSGAYEDPKPSITNNYYQGDYAGGNVIKDINNSQLSFDNERTNPMQTMNKLPDATKSKTSWLQIVYWIVGIIVAATVLYSFVNNFNVSSN